MKADPKVSAGARLERAAMRNYLRRRLKTAVLTMHATEELEILLKWVLNRSRRYDREAGGLGKK